MNMYIYAFGSLCRGEIALDSDIDLLAITDGYDERLNKNVFSIYSCTRIQEIWEEGNPFSWHLYSESKLIYSCTGFDFIKSLGMPNEYKKGIDDCKKFYSLFIESLTSIEKYGANVFELSTIFLAIRNIATCYSLFVNQQLIFSRNSALLIKENNIKISHQCYEILKRSRILSVRGEGEIISDFEFDIVHNELSAIGNWMEKILSEVMQHGRI